MSIYTVLRLHPTRKVVPTEAIVKGVMEAMQVDVVDTASGSNRESFFERARKAIFPRMIETYGGETV